MYLKTLTILAFALVATVPSTFATPVALAPGGTVTTFTPTASTFSGSEIASFSMAFSNAYESGTAYEEVVNNSGLLDFYYQIANNASSTDSLARVTVGLYTGFTTWVDYLTGGAEAPTSATRQASGDSVGFYIDVAPGTTSDWLEVATTATSYVPGTIALIDTVTTDLGGYGPAVPEPLSLGLLSAGLVLLGVVRWRRADKNI